MLEENEVNEIAAKQMILAYKRIFITPLGVDLGLGSCIENENKGFFDKVKDLFSQK